MTNIAATIIIRDVDEATDVSGEPVDPEEVRDWFENIDAEELGLSGATVESDVALHTSAELAEQARADLCLALLSDDEFVAEHASDISEAIGEEDAPPFDLDSVQG